MSPLSSQRGSVVASRHSGLSIHILSHQQEAESVSWEWNVAFEISKQAHSDRLHLARSHLQNLPKQHYQLGTSYSNAQYNGETCSFKPSLMEDFHKAVRTAACCTHQLNCASVSVKWDIIKTIKHLASHL